MKETEIKKTVRESYAKIADRGSSCCIPDDSCCGSSYSAQDVSRKLGYSEDELKAAPEGANLGLGCGNPVALASLKQGETVLDLGSGAGFDCFIAANKVGQGGKVIGVDMTQEMILKARENAEKNNYENVEFRLGEIENLPAADHSVDVIISNCVINLAPNKSRVFQEAFRVLKPGGRMYVSDIVLLDELPDYIKDSADAYVGCVSGAIQKDEYLKTIQAAGFSKISLMSETVFPFELIIGDPTAKKIREELSLSPEKLADLAAMIASIQVSAEKN